MIKGEDLTKLILAWRDGDEEARELLMEKVYEDLAHLASRYVKREGRNHMLETSALLHEAFLRLDALKQIEWQDRTHFFAFVSTIMRRVLVDYARRRKAKKRGEEINVTMDVLADIPQPEGDDPVDLIDLDQALCELEQEEPDQVRIVEMKFFADMNHEEIAEVLGISKITVGRRWRRAKAWLYLRLGTKH